MTVWPDPKTKHFSFLKNLISKQNAIQKTQKILKPKVKFPNPRATTAVNVALVKTTLS